MRITYLEPWSQSVKITYSDICNKFKETKSQRQQMEVKMLRDIELLYLAFSDSLKMPRATYDYPVGPGYTKPKDRVTYTTTLTPKDAVMGNVVDAQNNHAISFTVIVGVANSPNENPGAFIQIHGSVAPGRFDGELIYEVEGELFTVISTSDCGRFDKICHHMQSKLMEALS